jgi:hypothetical protein
LVTVGGAEEGREPPIRCFFRCTWSLILIFAVVNAPLTLCVAVIHAIA